MLQAKKSVSPYVHVPSSSHQKHPSTSSTPSLRPNPIPGLSLSAATETKLQVVEVLQVTPSLLSATNSGALLPPPLTNTLGNPYTHLHPVSVSIEVYQYHPGYM